MVLWVAFGSPQFDPELRLLPVWDCLVLHVLPMSVCVSSRISALPTSKNMPVGGLVRVNKSVKCQGCSSASFPVFPGSRSSTVCL